jgi:hypothetical protein
LAAFFPFAGPFEFLHPVPQILSSDLSGFGDGGDRAQWLVGAVLAFRGRDGDFQVRQAHDADLAVGLGIVAVGAAR